VGFKAVTRSLVGRLWLSLVIVLLSCLQFASGQTGADAGGQSDKTADPTATSDLLQAVDRLVQQNGQLEKQNRELMEQIDSLRQALAARTGDSTSQPQPASLSQMGQSGQATPPTTTVQEQQTTPAQESGQISSDYEQDEPVIPLSVAERKAGTYTPGLGYKLVESPQYGDVNLSIYAYVRYLNQLALKSTYTNAFGQTSNLDLRQDIQLNKVQIKLLGWFANPKFRYFLYTWTSNTNQGQGAQVVVAGNLNYEFSKAFVVSGGITSLPGTRSVEGNFPYWESVDSRNIADEFFRPSYTNGVWARGEPIKGLKYWAMLGVNNSILGVNAGQLPDYLSTYSTALVWMPTTKEFGPGFGDYEYHEKLATRLGIHFSHSIEGKQSQPNAEEFENTQIRLSDGSIVFTPNLFGPGITVDVLRYRMVSTDAGIKYHGFSLWGEGYFRWLDKFSGPGTAGLPELVDHGFQLQTSQMIIPKTLQLYAGGSSILGQYGTPWDARVGLNFYPFRNRLTRLNTEGLYLNKSPVGYFAVPFTVGGYGWVFHTNWELAF
jgi:hypothetical protein